MLELAGRRRDLRKTKDDGQDGRHTRRCTPQCTSHSTRLLYPRNSGRNDNLRDPLCMYPSLLVSIKGGGGHPLRGLVGSLGTHRSEHTHSLLASTSLFATLNPSSSRDLGASLPLSPRLYPYYEHSGYKIIQCPRTPLCWTYGPVAGTRINPCVTVLPLASTSGTRKHAASQLKVHKIISSCHR